MKRRREERRRGEEGRRGERTKVHGLERLTCARGGARALRGRRMDGRAVALARASGVSARGGSPMRREDGPSGVGRTCRGN